jgi:hypothetical protein
MREQQAAVLSFLQEHAACAARRGWQTPADASAAAGLQILALYGLAM